MRQCKSRGRDGRRSNASQCSDCAWHLSAEGVLGLLSQKIFSFGRVVLAPGLVIGHMASSPAEKTLALVSLRYLKTWFNSLRTFLSSFGGELNDMTDNASSIGLKPFAVLCSSDRAYTAWCLTPVR